jgi:hypothetical protein
MGRACELRHPEKHCLRLFADERWRDFDVMFIKLDGDLVAVVMRVVIATVVVNWI